MLYSDTIVYAFYCRSLLTAKFITKSQRWVILLRLRAEPPRRQSIQHSNKPLLQATMGEWRYSFSLRKYRMELVISGYPGSEDHYGALFVLRSVRLTDEAPICRRSAH